MGLLLCWVEESPRSGKEEDAAAHRPSGDARGFARRSSVRFQERREVVPDPLIPVPFHLQV